MVKVAGRFGRYGYRMVTGMLRAEGWVVNHKRVERIWREEGLKVPKKQPKRGRLWLTDGSCIRLRPLYRHHVWAYDFVADRTHDGRRVPPPRRGGRLAHRGGLGVHRGQRGGVLVSGRQLRRWLRQPLERLLDRRSLARLDILPPTLMKRRERPVRISECGNLLTVLVEAMCRQSP